MYVESEPLNIRYADVLKFKKNPSHLTGGGIYHILLLRKIVMQPLNYLQSTTGLIWVIACIPLGFLLTFLAYLTINKVPAKWLCDYNETPSADLLSGERVNYKKSGIILSFIVSASLVMCRLQFNKGYDIYFLLLTLIIFLGIMISVADIKYTIIPDQFTVALGVLGVAVSVYDIVRGYNILHQSWWSPLAGAALGAGVMIIIDLLGMLIYKKDGMGFGDVKLFFAVGLFTGFPGTIYALIISLITASICFVVILIVSKTVSSHKNSELSEQDNIEENQEISDEDNADISAGSHLAFGPYIAIAVIVYAALFDVINYLAELYMSLFY